MNKKDKLKNIQLYCNFLSLTRTNKDTERVAVDFFHRKRYGSTSSYSASSRHFQLKMSYYSESEDSQDIPSRLLTVNGGEDADGEVTNDDDAAMIAQEISASFQNDVVRTMVDRFMEVKLRILKEHEGVCADKDLMYTTKIRKLQDTIESLTTSLDNANERNAKLELDQTMNTENSAIRHIRHVMMRGRGPSALNCLKSWKKYCTDQRNNRKMEKIAMKWSRKNGLVKAMQIWAHNTAESRKEKDDAMHNAKLETVTREIITRYENELEKLRTGIKEAHIEIARGHVQRQQLEEKMRRTFLKGMTAMNMEALELFNKAAQNDASFMNAGGVSNE